MADEAEKPHEEIPAPPPAERRAWWWRIYLWGSASGSTLFVLLTSRYEPLAATLLRVILLPFFVAPLLPIGLAFDFGGNLDGIAGSSGTATTQTVIILLEILTVPLAYCLYVLHLRLTLKAGTRRAFFLLMLSLVFLITASFIGCAKLADRPIGLQ